jgi:hypothetical protein
VDKVVETAVGKAVRVAGVASTVVASPVRRAAGVEKEWTAIAYLVRTHRLRLQLSKKCRRVRNTRIFSSSFVARFVDLQAALRMSKRACALWVCL